MIQQPLQNSQTFSTLIIPQNSIYTIIGTSDRIEFEALWTSQDMYKNLIGELKKLMYVESLALKIGLRLPKQED